MAPEQINLVQKSFGKLALNKEAVGDAFYTRLFEIDPSLRPMFKGDIKVQAQKLIAMLAVAVSNLKHPDLVVKQLRDMGARHRGYGVTEPQYGTVAAALLATLQVFLGPDYTPELEQAWVATYTLVAGQMQQGAAA